MTDQADVALNGLPSYLEEKRAAMAAGKTYAEAYGVPIAVQPMEARAVVAGRTGIREITIRQFRLLSDSGPDFAGHDLGPSSPEIMLGALASCIAHTWLIHAALDGVTLFSVAVSATADMQSASAAFPHPSMPIEPFNIAYEAVISSHARAELLQQLHEKVRTHCPLLALLSAGRTCEGRLRIVRSDGADSPAAS